MGTRVTFEMIIHPNDKKFNETYSDFWRYGNKRMEIEVNRKYPLRKRE